MPARDLVFYVAPIADLSSDKKRQAERHAVESLKLNARMWRLALARTALVRPDVCS